MLMSNLTCLNKDADKDADKDAGQDSGVCVLFLTY